MEIAMISELQATYLRNENYVHNLGENIRSLLQKRGLDSETIEDVLGCALEMAEAASQLGGAASKLLEVDILHVCQYGPDFGLVDD